MCKAVTAVEMWPGYFEKSHVGHFGRYSNNLQRLLRYKDVLDFTYSTAKNKVNDLMETDARFTTYTFWVCQQGCREALLMAKTNSQHHECNNNSINNNDNDTEAACQCVSW